MNQRGQFFLIAALIAVAVLLSTGTVFTRARAPQEETSAVFLANEMKDEVINLMNRDAFQGNPSTDTWNRIEGLAQNYSLLNPLHEIIIFYGESGKGIIAKSYKQGVESTVTSGVTYDAIKITFTYGSSTYTFDRTQGKEFHVFIKKEGENGKTIATR